MLLNNPLNINKVNNKYLIKKYNHSYFKVNFLFFFYKFYKNILLNFFFNADFSIKINKRKNLFFKKKESRDSLISKRISIVLKRRKRFKLFKSKKIDKGNFFLKKFFFKILLKNRKFLNKLFYYNKPKKQNKLTKKIYFFSEKSNNRSTSILEHSLLNMLLKSNLFFFHKDVFFFIKSGFVYINGLPVTDHNSRLNEGDIIQLPINNIVYKYVSMSRKFLKKKMSLFRFTTWKFFKKKFFKKKNGFRIKKRKSPKYLHLFCQFKLNTPRFLEIDFFTLSIFFLKRFNTTIQPTYYLNKSFSYKLLPLYNFKKIN